VATVTLSALTISSLDVGIDLTPPERILNRQDDARLLFLKQDFDRRFLRAGKCRADSGPNTTSKTRQNRKRSHLRLMVAS
jgi:hypothetical protein